MRAKFVKITCLIGLGLAFSGCSKCGGWEKFNLPYSASVCDDTSHVK